MPHVICRLLRQVYHNLKNQIIYEAAHFIIRKNLRNFRGSKL